MDHRKHNSIDAWDDGVFGTGNTSPPKSHSGIIALLLILVIFLSGIVSLLSFMNIRLFQQLSEQAKQMENRAPMSFSDTDVHESETMPEEILDPQHIQEDVSISLNKSPQSVDNIPQQGAMSWQEIYEKNNPSVVSILCSTETGTAEGSGVILSQNGFIVTSCTLVSEAETIIVTFHDGETISAVVVGADSMTDLAVIHVDARELNSAEFGDSDALRVGDTVAAMGSGSLTDGIVSAICRNVSYPGRDLDLIQSGVALTSAGGPLVNCYGQVIGINTLPEEGQAVGYAVPSSTVKFIVDQLIAQGYVSGRPTLGLTGETITPFDQYYFHIPEGLYLNDVDPHSDAYEQDITPGHILISLDGLVITSQIQLEAFVNKLSIGDTVTAVFYRDGEEHTMTLTVTEYAG